MKIVYLNKILLISYIKTMTRQIITFFKYSQFKKNLKNKS